MTADADAPDEVAFDEVDRITAAWQRERPDLDVSPLQVLSRVSRLSHHLDLARRLVEKKRPARPLVETESALDFPAEPLLHFSEAEGQAAHTIVSALKRFNGYSLVDAELRTGRTHQIRVHLASSGFPIVGDDKYGRDETRTKFSKLGFTRMFLLACRL